MTGFQLWLHLREQKEPVVAYVVPVSELGKQLDGETRHKIGNHLVGGEKIRRIAHRLGGGEKRHKAWRRRGDGEKMQWIGELPVHREQDW